MLSNSYPFLNHDFVKNMIILFIYKAWNALYLLAY